MLRADQLGLANSDVFGQGILEIGQGKVSEKSGNFTFYSLWEPCNPFPYIDTFYSPALKKGGLYRIWVVCHSVHSLVCSPVIIFRFSSIS